MKIEEIKKVIFVKDFKMFYANFEKGDVVDYEWFEEFFDDFAYDVDCMIDYNDEWQS